LEKKLEEEREKQERILKVERDKEEVSKNEEARQEKQVTLEST
jgi:hypothetical protein